MDKTLASEAGNPRSIRGEGTRFMEEPCPENTRNSRSKPMNEMEIIEERIRERFPTADVKMEKALTEPGRWWLDVTLSGEGGANERSVTIEWRPDSKQIGIHDLSRKDGNLPFSTPDYLPTTVDEIFDETVRILSE